GNWTWTPSALAKGSWTFEVQKAGQSGWSSFSLTIDPDLDRYPIIESAWDNAGTVTGSLASGASTDDTTPTLRGTGPANSTISLRYKLGSGNYTTVDLNVDSSGNWTWTPSALAKGSWTFEVQKAGQSGWSSFSLTIDPDLDRYPIIESAWDNAGTVTGSLASGASTDDTTPTLRGTGPANSTISLRYKLGSGNYTTVNLNVDSSGNWTWTPSALAKGSWTFEVQNAGQSDWNSFTLTIGVAPEIPVLVDFYDNVGTPGAVIPDGEKAKTDDTTPTLRGTGTPNSIVHIQSAKTGDSWGDLGTARVDNNGNWEYTPPSALDYATWQFRVKASNALGDTAWAQKVYLNIVKGDDFSGFVDLENLNIGYIYGIDIALNKDVSVTAHHKYSHYVKNSGIPEFGSAIRVGTYDPQGNSTVSTLFLKFSKNKGTGEPYEKPSVNHAHYVDFQIANPTNSAMTSVMSLSTYSDNNSHPPMEITLNVPLGPNEIKTISSDDFIGYISGTYFIGAVRFYSDVYFDNINYTFKNASTSSSTLSEVNSDAIHLLEGIEEINQSPITGKESQIDTLQLTGKDQILDLKKLSSKIESIEVFDITGRGDNTLKLDLTTLLQHGEKGLFIEDGKTQLMVKGNEGDVVELKDILPEGSDISEWQHQEGTVTIAGVKYNVYSHDDAELLVQQGVRTELV
ncbi:Ig-like domain-containing protein, partial [Pantoea sp. DY-5]|uniref:Ig-like domain-containing protein n=1 Tax=Pantoea sp. DY-5 TaxID=2871488 RepID=UPI001C98902E